MPSKNEVHLIGHAGKDADLKFTTNGTAVVKFTLATGGGKYPTDWHNIVVWNERAAEIKKGDAVEIKGRISYRSWDGKDGQKKYVTEIVSGYAKRLNADDEVVVSDRKAAPKTIPTAYELGITDEDVPF